jgi:hypothetical protein
MRMRAGLLALVASAGAAAAASLPVVPYPRDYQTSLVRYAVVDRVDGFSRDLYVSRDALEAVRRDPKLREFPAGVLFALDVHRAKQTGRDRKSGAPIFATSRRSSGSQQGRAHAAPDAEDRARLRQPELGVRRDSIRSPACR